MVHVTLLVNEKVVQESCTRIGIASKKEKILWPSCYLIKRDGEYYIAHFKEFFLMKDGGYNNISESDIARLHSAVFCLKTWGLIDATSEDIPNHSGFIFVLPHKEKEQWKIHHKINTFHMERNN